MDYSTIIGDKDFVWSYSRLKAFEKCRYGWLLSYIYNQGKSDLFFSQYGSFLHRINEKYLTNEISRDDLVKYYLTNFKKSVTAKAPNKKIFDGYFTDGLRYCSAPSIDTSDVDLVEENVAFTICGKKCVGYVDLVKNGEKLVVVDHKSRALKPKSGKAKPNKNDIELDNYFKQLYLYSIPIYERYGKYPDELWINCMRTQQVIKEVFRLDKLNEAIDWADKLISTITKNDDWSPNVDWFACKYLCDYNNECEYFS